MGRTDMLIDPKMLPTRSEHDFNYKSPEELQVKSLRKPRLAKGKGVVRANKDHGSLSKSQDVILGVLGFHGPL